MIPFRERLLYKVKLSRVRRALLDMGMSADFRRVRTEDLIGKIDLDKLEEFMLATWNMFQFQVAFLKEIGTVYTAGSKYGNLYNTLADVAKYMEPLTPFIYYVPEEAKAMEHASRATFAFLKSLRKIKRKALEEDQILKAYGWSMPDNWD